MIAFTKIIKNKIMYSNYIKESTSLFREKNQKKKKKRTNCINILLYII